MWLDIDLTKKENLYLLEHKINGHTVLPVSFYIYMVWESYANMCGVTDCEHLPIELHDVSVYKRIDLSNMTKIDICVEINTVHNTFRVSHNNEVVCDGHVQTLSDELVPMPIKKSKIYQQMIDRSEIYRILKACGHEMGSSFQLIVRATPDGSSGEIECSKENWVSKIDD